MNSPFLDPDLLKEGAGEGPIGSRVQVFRETASTNDLLLQMAEHGEPEGTVIFAERQTAGRGRFRRPWHSADGLGLWFSVLLRRALTDPTKLTPYVAVCVTEALEAFAGESVGIKAPNDVYGRFGKLAGILIEARTGASPFAVIGIGINVNQGEQDFPPDLTASSLALETGRQQDRLAVARMVLRRLNARLGEIEEESYLPLYSACLARRVHPLQAREL